ncbi:carcinine transporter-like [Pseudomyrmex gracilis]|uniref:carcinine transporter-like n=1 Tax=Pseudomyrmex gracilis TaxID=219809 RepID=UPI0009958255|nr:carcinine transporter-like [Pseudomyrmex gracilis]XP_020280141.1 carcinine transporter-like [Pseudomyrmex gracilis]XP_020280142.1 carcinine transporter-like [Pseudomyrmex gracilis]
MKNSNGVVGNGNVDVTGPNETTTLRPKLETFDDILPCVGDFGRYQWLLLLALLPYSVAYSTLYFSQFFLTLVPQEHWCRINELVSSNLTQDQRVEIGIPKSPNYPYYDRCHRKDLDFSLVSSHTKEIRSSDWKTNKTVSCSQWEYNFTQIPYASIAAELDWVCDQEYLISTAQSIFFCGSVVGGFLFGWIADHKGRIPALILCNGVALLASIATASANTFWSFAVCRFLTGLAFDNCINIPLIIVVEYMAVNRRTLVVNVAFGVYFAVGSTILPWIAYYVANWRFFAYLTAVPMMSVFVTPWILPESARWFVANGKIDKVVQKLRRIAKINKRSPDARIYEIFVQNLTASNGQTESATIFDLLKTPRLAKNAILMIFFWSLTVIAFDGHVYSLKLIPSSVFVSFSLACATELPAGLLLTLLLDRWGRRFCGFITLAMTSLFSFAELLLQSIAAKLTMSVLSRFCLNMAANVGLQYAAELLPTPIRTQGVSLIHIFGIVAHSVAPYVVDSAKIWDGLPMMIISMVAIVGATLILFLPETLGRDLPQTLHQGEEFGKDQKFWTLPCCDGSYPSRHRHYHTREI